MAAFDPRTPRPCTRSVITAFTRVFGRAMRGGTPMSCEGVMENTDALKYLPQMGLDPLQVVGCAAANCPNYFALANAFAIEATVGEKASIAFFCSAGCYLNEIPVNCCARA